MKLIMHCGQAKTGSSSIQTALKSLSQELIQKNILYHSEHNNGHYDFLHIVGKKNRTPKDKHKKIMDRAQRTILKIKKLAREFQPNFLILSSEAFFKYTEDEIIKTINSLGIEFTDIYCIVYVRNPSDFYLSITQQKIKASHKIDNPTNFKQNIVEPLMKWENYVGKENFFGGIFHKKTLSQGDVVVDFIEKVEKITQEKIEINDDYSVNESITAEQMILLQNYRYNFLRSYDNQFLPSSSNLLKFFLRINRLKLLGVKPKLRPEINEVILYNNREYIEGVDNLLGGNSMAEISGLSAAHLSSVSRDIEPIEKVKNILSSYNEEVYYLQKNIIVEYNKNLKLAYKDYLAAFNNSEKSRLLAAKAYFDYLKSNDYFSAAQLGKLEKIDAKDFDGALFDFLAS